MFLLTPQHFSLSSCVTLGKLFNPHEPISSSVKNASSRHVPHASWQIKWDTAWAPTFQHLLHYSSIILNES